VSAAETRGPVSSYFQRAVNSLDARKLAKSVSTHRAVINNLTEEEMRVLEGRFSGRPLVAVEGAEARPSARRTRETVFEFVESRVLGARFLDLCAGSGAVGIEALSRGAARVTFVDQSAAACRAVRQNLETCGGPDAALRHDVVTAEADKFLRVVVGDESLAWDLAFFDPPYSADYAPVLELFGGGRVFKRRGGVLVVEHPPDKRMAERVGVLRRWRAIRLGDSCVSFYEQKYARPREG
jgi:16S rRNA (guanine966-N2)-methyltransferase